MLNHVVLVGRLVKNPDVQETENGKKVSMITLAVNRAYKNVNGEYDTDFIDCTLWTGIAENTAEYCKSGDVIGIKGRIQTRLIDKDDGTKYKRVDVIADRVTFLSTSKNRNIESLENEDSDENSDINFNNINEEKKKNKKEKK